jgi:hypothetical protein
MERTDRKRNLLAAIFAVASLSVAPNLAIAAAANCPAALDTAAAQPRND